MDGEGVGALDGISDGLKDVLGPGEGEVETAARAALLDAARGEDASGWEGAATGGDDELSHDLSLRGPFREKNLSILVAAGFFFSPLDAFWSSGHTPAPGAPG